MANTLGAVPPSWVTVFEGLAFMELMTPHKGARSSRILGLVSGGNRQTGLECSGVLTTTSASKGYPATTMACREDRLGLTIQVFQVLTQAAESESSANPLATMVCRATAKIRVIPA